MSAEPLYQLVCLRHVKIGQDFYREGKCAYLNVLSGELDHELSNVMFSVLVASSVTLDWCVLERRHERGEYEEEDVCCTDLRSASPVVMSTPVTRRPAQMSSGRKLASRSVCGVFRARPTVEKIRSCDGGAPETLERF
jgi:hypothetical protein